MLRHADAEVLAVAAREQPVPRMDGPVVDAQQFEEGLRQRHDPVLAAFALADVDDHPGTVDVVGLEADRLRDTQPGGVAGHQDRPVLEVANAAEELEDLLTRGDLGQVLLRPGIRDGLEAPGPLQGDLVEEAQGGDVVAEHAVRDLGLLDQVEQEGSHLVRSQLIGGTAEVLRELGDAVQVVLLGPGGEVADLEILDHPATQWCHGNLLLRGSQAGVPERGGRLMQPSGHGEGRGWEQPHRWTGAPYRESWLSGLPRSGLVLGANHDWIATCASPCRLDAARVHQQSLRVPPQWSTAKRFSSCTVSAVSDFR